MNLSTQGSPIGSSVSPIGAKMRQMYRQSTPDFKTVLRENCRARMRENRSRLFNNHRENLCAEKKVHFSDNVLAHEWNSLKDICQNDPELDEMASLYEEIQRELREEEDLLMKQFLEVYQKDIDCLVTDYSSPGVLCPICQKNNLLQNKSAIFCHCGFRIDTGCGGITIEQLHTNLLQYSSAHEQQCSAAPSFYVDSNTAECEMLMMVCPSCDFMAIVA